MIFKKAVLISLIMLTCSCPANAASLGGNGGSLRSGPGEGYPVIQDLPRYYPLKIIKKSGEWYKVSFLVQRGKRQTGWIRKSSVASKNTLLVTGCRVSAGNLRSGPSTRYSRVAKIYQGYVLEIMKRKGSWYKVKVVDPPENRIGWVYRSLVN